MGLVKAMDVSSHQDRDIRSLITDHQIQHVIPKLYLPEEVISRDHSITQAKYAFEMGCTVGGYFWGYKDLDPHKSVNDALEVAELAGYTPPVLWCDVEPFQTNSNVPGVDWLYAAQDTAEEAGVRFGIYTGPWVWQLLGNPTDFWDVPLWTAQYYLDRLPRLGQIQLYGGWESAAGHQYTSDPVDLSVFLPEYTTHVNRRGPAEIAYDMELSLAQLDNELTWLYHKGRKAAEIKESVNNAKIQVGILQGLKNEVGGI